VVERLTLAFREALNVYELDLALLAYGRVRPGLPDAGRAWLDAEAAAAVGEVGLTRPDDGGK
jgi:hypothetical protein